MLPKYPKRLNILSYHQRLKTDFKDTPYVREPYYIELATPEIQPRKPKTVEEILSRHVSSPLQNEELIVPLTIDQKTMDKYTLTPKRRNRRLKTHVSHKAYKKLKFNSRSKTKSKSKSKTNSYGNKSSSIINFI